MSACQWRTWNVIKKNNPTKSDETRIASIPAPVQEKVVKAKKTIAPVKAKKKATGKKVIKLTYYAMVTKAILELKKKKGSSRQSIMKYLQGTYKVTMDLGLSV